MVVLLVTTQTFHARHSRDHAPSECIERPSHCRFKFKATAVQAVSIVSRKVVLVLEHFLEEDDVKEREGGATLVVVVVVGLHVLVDEHVDVSHVFGVLCALVEKLFDTFLLPSRVTNELQNEAEGRMFIVRLINTMYYFLATINSMIFNDVSREQETNPQMSF